MSAMSSMERMLVYHSIWRSENIQAASPDWEDIAKELPPYPNRTEGGGAPADRRRVRRRRRHRWGADAAAAGQALVPVADRQLAGPLSSRARMGRSLVHQGGASRGFARRPRRNGSTIRPGPVRVARARAQRAESRVASGKTSAMNGSVRKPNFLGIGATKARTASLRHYLKQHPEIFIPDDYKEPGYFCRGGDDSSIFFRVKTPEAYFGMFQAVRDEKAWGEITPHYLNSPYAAQNIRDEVPEARLIVSIRNPVERAFSLYQMRICATRTTTGACPSSRRWRTTAGRRAHTSRT